MAGPDMDVIKEIPGYKVILKAVLKSQIQQLVEQLASHTDEESVILTASISDGTLSHLGSDSGKFFISDHDEFKSQFLGFCLKRSHEKKREEEREKEEAKMMQHLQQSHPHPVGPPMLGAGHMGMTSPHLSQRFPSLQASPRPRFSGSRHQPYVRLGKRQSIPHLSKRTSTPKSSMVRIKVEKVDETEASNSNRSSFGNSDQLEQNNQSEPSRSADSDTPAEEASNILNDIQPSGGLSLESDLSNLMDSTSQPDGEQKATVGVEQSETESGVPIVKVEAITESELDFEITGVEPGANTSSALDNSWAHSFSQGQDWADTSLSPGSMQGYNVEAFGHRSEYFQHSCPYCDKFFHFKSKLNRHIKTHTRERDFVCTVCNRGFMLKHHLKEHLTTHITK